MLRLTARMTHFDADTVNNGLDWLTSQQQLCRAERTPFHVIHRGHAFDVRHYASPESGHADAGSQAAGRPAPVVLVPPLAVRPSMYDLLPERSFVRYLQSRHFQTYLVDWHPPRRDEDELGLADYAIDMLAEALQAVRCHSDQRELSLVGYCMGGLFALLHAGTKRDDDIGRIASIATPINMHDSAWGAAVARTLHQSMARLHRRTHSRLHDLDSKLFHVPGRLNALAFKLSQPASGLATTYRMLHNLADRRQLSAYSTTRDWLDNMRDYPGALMQDIIEIWLNNALVAGSITLGDVETSLSRVSCPVLAIVGESDAVVGQASTRALLDHVASQNKKHIVAPGGHFGVIAGSRAPEYCWPKLTAWLMPYAAQTSPDPSMQSPRGH